MKSEEERLVKKRLHGRWKKVVSILACIVVFCTTYALILPAITKEKATDCGIEEHQHGEECFSEENELICTKQEHTHGPECYSDETEVETDTQADAGSEKDTGIAGQMQGEAEAGMAVAAEADAVSETEMEAMAEEVAAEAAPIAVGSASIAGSSVGVAGLSSFSAYLIVAEDTATGTYYALSSDGTGVPVSYDSITQKVSVGQNVNLADIQWYSYDVDGNSVTRTAGLRNVRTGDYLNLGNGQVTATNSRELTVEAERSTDQAKIYYRVCTGGSIIRPIYTYYGLGFEGASKTFNVTTGSSNASAASVRLVAYVSEDIPVESSGIHQEVEYHFPNHKTIDYLGDGKENPDTDVQGEDLYRLYLDITGRMEPTDLLIVVDRSSSMKDNKDMQVEGSTQKKERYKVVNELLNGTESGSTATDEGLISRVLNANSQNRVAVCSFEGKVTTNNQDSGPRILGSVDTGYTYTMDSEISRGWYTQENYNNVFIDITPPNWQGTNYEAGLLTAQDLFEQVKDEPKKKKIMIFISDGVPTYYIDQNGNRQGDSWLG